MQRLMSSLGEALVGSVQLKVSDLSYSEVIFRTFKLCFPRPCTISCSALWGSVRLFGVFGVFLPPTFCATIFLRKLFHFQDIFPL